MKHKEIIIIGAGPAGIFASLTAEAKDLLLLEQSGTLLAKVRVSGGGRCNVTHACFDPAKLVGFYPRGGKALRGPLSRFGPGDMIEWLESRGVALKTEEDGRVFPKSDSSQTIIDCLLSEAARLGVEIRRRQKVEKIWKEGNLFHLGVAGDEMTCNKLLLATGGSRGGHALAKSLGHTIVDPVPSLFSFNIPDFPQKLAGVSVADVRLQIGSFTSEGSLLVTHWGFSGPAVLKLSAWAARALHRLDYETELQMSWVGRLHFDAVRRVLLDGKDQRAAKQVARDVLFGLPRSLWEYLAVSCGIDGRWREASKKQLGELAHRLTHDVYKIEGKTSFKQEFVTAGGVDLDEVNFKTMESKKVPGLYFAGEILDIDGVTGGFNFQNAWTTGYLAGQALRCDG